MHVETDHNRASVCSSELSVNLLACEIRQVLSPDSKVVAPLLDAIKGEDAFDRRFGA